MLANIISYLFRDPYWDSTWEENYSKHCEGTLDLDKIESKELLSGLCVTIVSGFYLGYYCIKHESVCTAWSIRLCGLGMLLAAGIF